MRIIVFGPPGSGKGTQAKLIEKKFSLKHIALGDVFRKTAREKTELGKKIKNYIDKGKFVPDALVVRIVKKILEEKKLKSFVFDGFPRNIFQAKEAEKFLKADIAIYLNVSDKEIIKRLSSRRQCKKCNTIYGLENPPKKKGICDKCHSVLYQRKDDKPAIIKKRILIYHKQTKPLINFYEKEGILRRINAEQNIKKTFSDVSKILNKPD